MVTSTMPFDESRLGVLLGNARTRQHYIADLISGHVPKDCQLLIGQLMEPDVLVRLPVTKIAENYWFRDAARKSRNLQNRRSLQPSFSPYESQWTPVKSGPLGQGKLTLNHMNACTPGKVDTRHICGTAMRIRYCQWQFGECSTCIKSRFINKECDVPTNISLVFRHDNSNV